MLLSHVGGMWTDSAVSTAQDLGARLREEGSGEEPAFPILEASVPEVLQTWDMHAKNVVNKSMNHIFVPGRSM